MTRLFTTSESAQIGLLHSQLESAGIACEIRNDNISASWPGNAPFQAELWILRDEQVADARELLAALNQAPAPPDAKPAVGGNVSNS